MDCNPLGPPLSTGFSMQERLDWAAFSSRTTDHQGIPLMKLLKNFMRGSQESSTRVWFLNLSEHQNQLGRGLVNHRLLGPAPDSEGLHFQGCRCSWCRAAPRASALHLPTSSCPFRSPEGPRQGPACPPVAPAPRTCLELCTICVLWFPDGSTPHPPPALFPSSCFLNTLPWEPRLSCSPWEPLHLTERLRALGYTLS